MLEVLLARNGFRDETAMLRLHHAAELSVRTHAGGLPEIALTGTDRDSSGTPMCVAFCCVLDEDGANPAVIQALAALRESHPHVVFAAFLEGIAWSATARSSGSVALFDAGADEVVQTWVEPSEYAARIRALTRRRGWTAADSLVLPLQPGERPRLDLERRILVGSENVHELTSKECIVMRALLESADVATRALIAERLWTDGWYGTKKAIDMHVANLRRKLRVVSGQDWCIETVRGAGFVLVPAAAKVAG